MDIFVLAHTFQKQASYETFKAILEILDLAQALTINPYEDLSTEEELAAKEISHLAAVMADKAYTKGLKISELNYLVGKLKDKVLQCSLNPELDSMKNDLNELLTKLQHFPLSDVDAQAPEVVHYKHMPFNSLDPEGNR